MSSLDPAAVHLIHVFADGPGGGNPAPTVVDASEMSDEDMRGVARRYGHESGFVLPAPAGSACDFTFRFWVPNHEMEMCGHATVAAVWLLHRLGRLPRDRIAIETRSGIVEACVVPEGGERHSDKSLADPSLVDDSLVEISQPVGRVEPVSDAHRGAILSVLGLTEADLAPSPVRNAATSRVKTLVPLKNGAVLDGLTPDLSRVEQVCEAIGSTGLYPFAQTEAATFDARQFPKSSGYPEDAATGIAAAALAFGLLADGLATPDEAIAVRQGRAMGRPSRIAVRFRTEGGTVSGCWVGGPCRLA